MLESLQQKFQALLFTRQQQQAYLEDLSALIEDGVPARQAVQTIAEIATGTMETVSHSILQKIAEGKPIADGMQTWFPQPVIEIIRAGEEGGTLVNNMTAAAHALGRQTAGFSAFIAATLYPLAVIIMGLIVSIFIKNSVFANFASIKPLDQWPENGQILYFVASFVQYWWWAILMIIIAIIFGMLRLLQELTGDSRQLIDSIPILSLYREITAARFMEILGLLISNGIVLKKALSIMRARAHTYLAWHIYLMEFRLSGGRENIADVLDTGIINKADILRLKVIAKGKGFEHALIRLGRLSAERTGKHIAIASKIF